MFQVKQPESVATTHHFGHWKVCSQYTQLQGQDTMSQISIPPEKKKNQKRGYIISFMQSNTGATGCKCVFRI